MEFIKKTIGELDLENIYLPVGWKNNDGTMGRFCTLDELDGEIEEKMADTKIKDNVGKIITAMLYGVVASMEGYPKVTKDAIRNLTSADRDFLIIMHHKIAFGNMVSFTTNCARCGKPNDITYDTDSLSVKFMPQDYDPAFTMDLPRPVIDKAGNIHKDISFILPTGWVQERVSPFGRSNPALATTVMLQMMTRRLGTLEAPIPEDIFKKMKSKSRIAVSKYIEDLDLGVNLKITEICSECGESFETMIPLLSLLGE